MKQSNPHLWRSAEILIPVFVLALLLWFTYGFFFEVPYSGFYFNPSNGRILEIFEPVDSQPTLQVGDQLKQIGSVSWDAFHEDRRLKFFEELQPGETVEIIVERDGQEIAVPWRFPGFKRGEFLFRFLNTWWLAFIFFLFGMAVQFFMRPKDTRWRLLTAANYLTACWLIAGTLSTWHMWESSGILHAVTWLMLPVYLNFHWIFPRPLRQIPSFAWIAFYSLSFVFAAGELSHFLPRVAYSLGFLVILAGSIALLIIHFARQPAQRRAVGLLAIAILVAFAPAAGLALTGLSNSIPQLAPIGLFALPIMPGTYIFVVYRRQLGGLELPANRLFSIYTYLVLLATLLLPLVVLPQFLSLSPEATPFLAVIITVLIAYASIRIFPAYQAFVEKNLLGIKLPYQNLPEIYSARITTSASLKSLVSLLNEEILPSLLVRQFGFLRIENSPPKVLLALGVDEKQILDEYDFSFLSSSTERYRSVHPVGERQPYPWARLILPLRVGQDILGFWLFGRRDPDDLYTQTEIPVLQSLANQTAIALSNILQTERLRSMYLANVDRYEEERLHLALELHDSILNQLAVLQMNLDKPSQKFQDAYDGLTKRLREIVSDLRPPMLNYGLEPAIRELAENLMERSKDIVQVNVDLQTNGSRYPSKVELHLFRIAQEACENALRHAQAENITISGTLLFEEIDLRLKDDGVGFDVGENLQLDVLIANKHFGLAGMIERAAIIGAEVRIESGREKGTKIRIVWKQDHA
jgi:signal transduction histidine kinase